MSRLFRRAVRLRVGEAPTITTAPVEGTFTGVEILAGAVDQLRVTFKVEKSTATLVPNTGEIQIYNLSERTRGLLDGDRTPRVPIVLEAGYGDDLGALLVGETASIGHERLPTGWVTKIRAVDGSAVKRVLVNRAFSANTPGAQVLNALIDDVAAKVKKIDVKAFKAAAAKDVGTAVGTVLRGLVVSGPADDVIQRLVEPAGYDFLHQDGEALLVKAGEALPREAVLLSPTTGLIGSAEIARDEIITLSKGEVTKAKLGTPQPDQLGVPVYKAKSLLNHRITPRSMVQIESAGVRGQIVVLHVVFTGDTHGAEWQVELEGRAA